MLLSGSFILAFGLYNIHSQSGVTEGGVLGLILLLDHWFGLSPSISSLVMNAACYVLGLRVLGWSFIVRSGVASLSFSAFYAILERFPRLWTGIAEMPLLAAESEYVCLRAEPPAGMTRLRCPWVSCCTAMCSGSTSRRTLWFYSRR